MVGIAALVATIIVTCVWASRHPAKYHPLHPSLVVLFAIKKEKYYIHVDSTRYKITDSNAKANRLGSKDVEMRKSCNWVHGFPL